MVSFARVRIGSGGELACRRCRVAEPASEMRSASVVAEELSAVAKEWSAGPGPNVTFLGAEPFLHPQLPIMIEAAATSGFERIRLRTDAGALSRQGNAEGALGAGVRHIEVILLGEGDIHDDLSGKSGLFAAARAGVAAFTSAASARDAQVTVGVSVPACTHIVKGLPQIAVAAAEFGAAWLHIDASALPHTEQNAALVVAALETATVNRLAGSVSGWRDAMPAPYDRTPFATMEPAR